MCLFVNVNVLIKKPELCSSGFTIQNKCAINHISLKMIQLSCLGVIYIFLIVFRFGVVSITSILLTLLLPVQLAVLFV